MNCEHCGAKVVDGGQLCAACGLSRNTTDIGPRPLAKVVPFHPKKRIVAPTPTGSARPRRAPLALWWIVAIVALCLLLPYLYPLVR